MKKYRLFISILATLMILILGGCGMTSQKETLTREQQDNVVRWIARGYEVQEVEFLQLSQNTSTRIYLLSIRLNGDKSLETTIPADSLDEFDASEGELLLGPIDNFEEIMKERPLEKTRSIDISSIRIVYLED
ncbi:hypothetical protein ACS60C_03530 [Streptococcus suis]|nr:hypothetical protein [Streptococcus suis]HEM3610689.1 hypothetical protein [Streptococcus suis]HEM3617047.1 hypothetical protein [Streptococcus suis]HEM3621032.1 hypothetical protein [Streptococcus suis]HEM3638598.1 hypothetical protein [Streptococcus suis]